MTDAPHCRGICARPDRPHPYYRQVMAATCPHCNWTPASPARTPSGDVRCACCGGPLKILLPDGRPVPMPDVSHPTLDTWRESPSPPRTPPHPEAAR